MSTPQLVVIQASSRSWSGGPDFSVNLLEGAPAVTWTVRGAIAAFPDVPVRIVAPAFDEGGLLSEVAQSFADAGEDVQVFYGFDESPLDRLLAVTAGLPDDALIVRADGLHFCADFAWAARLVDAAASEGLDCIKAPDDFPPPLTADIYRVGALRRARDLISPADQAFLVHPKFLLFARPDAFRTRYTQDLPPYKDEQLREIRRRSSELIQGIERLDVNEGLRVSHGDQLSFHYELTKRYLPDRPRLLDVACGDGFGLRLLQRKCASVAGVDLDEPSILRARELGPAEIGYHLADCTDMPFAPDSFDVVLSMETLEHVPVASFLREVRRVLTDDGVFIASTPQNLMGRIPFTPAHEHEFTRDELRGLLEQEFEIVDWVGIKAGTIFTPGDPVGTNSFVVCRPAGSGGAS